MNPTPQQVGPSFEQAPVQVDARGLRCPLPVIRLAEVARDAATGACIVVLASDPAARHDIPAWCRMRHHELVEVSEILDPTTGTVPASGGAQAERGSTDGAGGHAEGAQTDGPPAPGAPTAYLRFVVRIQAQPSNADGGDSDSARPSRAR